MIRNLVARLPAPEFLILGTLALLAAIQRVGFDQVNNYYLFTRPLWIYFDGGNPYAPHPTYFWDTYKYSPSFVLIVGWLGYLPDWLGVCLWNLLNAAVLAVGLRRALPEPRWALWATLIVALEALTAFQNLQSNALLTGLMLCAYADARDDRPVRGALWVALAAFIKIYGIAVAALFITTRRRWRAYAAMAGFGLLLALLPLSVLGGSLERLLQTYQAWLATVSTYTTVVQLSAMGLWQAWTGLELPFRPVQIAALLLTVSPLLRRSLWADQRYLRLQLATLLLFVVLFNQVAESPVYVIALTGVALVFLLSERTRWDVALLVAVLILSSLFTGDILPDSARKLWYEPLKLKVLPVLIVWVVALVRLWRLRPSAAAPAAG